jgi:hypothetical protein
MAQATKQAQAQQPGIKKLRDKVEKAEQQLQVCMSMSMCLHRGCCVNMTASRIC